MRQPIKYLGLILVLFSLPLGAQEKDQAFIEARGAYDQGNFTLAAKLFTDFSLKFPGDSRADAGDFLGAVSAIQGGNPTGGLEILRRFRRVYPQSPYNDTISYWEGRGYYILENWTEAAKAFESQVKSKQAKDLSSQSRYYWGVSLFNLGKKPDALKVWTEGSEDNLWNYRGVIQGGLVSLSLGDPGRTVVLLSPLTKRTDNQEILHGAFFYLTEASFQLGDYPAVQTWGDKFLASFPEDAQETKVRLLKGEAFVKLGKNALAEGEFRKVLKAKDSDSFQSAYFSLGNLLNAQSRWGESLAHFSGPQPLNLSPTQVQKIQSNAGLAAYKLQRWSEGAKWYDLASHGPDNQMAGESLISASAALFMDGKVKDSVSRLETYLATQDRGSRRWEAADLLAKYYVQVLQWDNAQRALSILINEFPENKSWDSYLLERSRIGTVKKDYVAALADAQKVLDKKPKSPLLGEALYMAAYIYSERKEPMRGEKYLFRILEEEPAGELYDRALLARGLAFYNGGNYEDAQGSWARLLRESPKSPHKTETLLNLGRLKYKQGQEAAAMDYTYQASLLLEGKAQAQALLDSAQQGGVKNAQRTLQILKELEEKYPDSELMSSALLLWGTILAQRGENDLAQGKWDKGLSKASPEVWEKIAYTKVLNLISQKNNPEKFLQTWEKRSRSSPLLQESYLVWADEALKSQDFPRAAEIGRKLGIIAPESPVLETLSLREALAIYENDIPGGRKKFQAYFTKYGQTSGASSGAKSLAALLVQKNLQEELTYWQENIEKFTPLIPVKTEILLAQARVILDLRWEDGLKILQGVMSSTATYSQKAEALVTASEGAFRAGKFNEAKEFGQKVPQGTDPFLRGRGLLSAALASRDLGEGINPLLELGANPGLPGLLRAQALYEAWTTLDSKTPQALKLAQTLVKDFPDSRWAALVLPKNK